jgi:putative hemin transport protein
LRRFGVTRTQALRLADPGVAQKLATSTLRTLLERAAEREVGLMFFTRSEGALQVRSGTIKNVKVMDDWLNVLDPGFSLHIAQGSLAQAWRVRKPSKGGMVTSLELYDAAGDESLVVYGVRGVEGYDVPAWRAVVDDVER